jgi:hypothetical protein
VQREPRATAEPTVLADDAGYTLWLEMSNAVGSERAIWRAISDDGVSYRFEPAADPVLEDAGDARAPSVVRDASGWALYYETGAGIRMARSADGIAFDAPTTPLAGDWHAPAAVVAPGGATLVFVQDGTGAPRAVYAPADVTDPVLWRAVERVGSPYALVESGPLGAPTLRLWFDAFGTESGSSVQFGEIVAIPPNDSIGFASAPASDPAALATYPFNPVFDRVVAFLEHRAERGPAVVRVPGREAYLLYYGGGKADGSEVEGLGVARNPP